MMKYPFLSLSLMSLPVVLAAAAPALAQITVSRAPAGAPDLGRMIAGSATTVLSVTAQGDVTRTSGNAIRLNGGSVTTPTISISCAVQNAVDLCASHFLQVTIQPLGGRGPAAITMLRAGELTGAVFRDGTPPAAPAMTFILNPMGVGTATFKLGMDVRLPAGAPSGPTFFDYSVTAVFL